MNVFGKVEKLTFRKFRLCFLLKVWKVMGEREADGKKERGRRKKGEREISKSLTLKIPFTKLLAIICSVFEKFNPLKPFHLLEICHFSFFTPNTSQKVVHFVPNAVKKCCQKRWIQSISFCLLLNRQKDIPFLRRASVKTFFSFTFQTCHRFPSCKR